MLCWYQAPFQHCGGLGIVWPPDRTRKCGSCLFCPHCAFVCNTVSVPGHYVQAPLARQLTAAVAEPRRQGVRWAALPRSGDSPSLPLPASGGPRRSSRALGCVTVSLPGASHGRLPHVSVSSRGILLSVGTPVVVDQDRLVTSPEHEWLQRPYFPNRGHSQVLGVGASTRLLGTQFNS